MALSIEHLSRYFAVNSIYLVVDTFQGNPHYYECKEPLRGETCLAIICYVVKLRSSMEYPDLIATIKRMEDMAHDAVMDGQLQYMFVKSFIPNVKRLFTVPKVEQLSDQDKKYLKSTEIVAGFINFLIQILDSEILNSERSISNGWCISTYASLRKGLKLLVAIVEDRLFQCPPHHDDELEEEFNNLPTKFEVLVNEAGNWVCSHFLLLLPAVSMGRFDRGKDALLQKVKLLIDKSTKSYIKFSELPRMDVSSRSGVVGSFLVIDSLVEDLENIMMMKKHRLNFKLRGRQDQIKTLHAGLKFLQDFLKDIRERPGRHADTLHELLNHIANLAYETEHLFYTRDIPNWYLNLRLPAISHKIKLTNKSLKQMNTGTMQSFGGEVSISQVHTIGTPEDMSENLSAGFQVIMARILDYLIGEPKTRITILIHGMPGIGKTTMAKALYNCSLACNYFDRHVWCVVSQQFNVRNLMVHILMSITVEPNKDRILKMKDADLGLEIYQTLKERRYLIVLDDIWHSELWYNLQSWFPDDGNGSRIMFTSRIRDTAPEDSRFHPLPFLSEGECWDLLAKKVFRNDSCPPQLESIGRRIAKKCHGIPLTVVVTAGILDNLEKNERVWEQVEKELDLLLQADKSNYGKILELSYEHLTYRMKACFLYLGAFPKDTEISVKRLFWLWIASGFVQKVEEKIPEEIAETYLLDLINRSLVMIARRRSDGGIKSCRMHDLLRDLCMKKAYEENFLASNNNDFSIYEKHQYLNVPSTSSAYQRTIRTNVRSIHASTELNSKKILESSLLRVLDVMPIKKLGSSSKFHYTYSIRIPRHATYQLSYLGTDHMPEGISHRLFNLEFLCIVNERDIFSIPKVMLQSVKLRHVLIRKEAEFASDCDSSQITNLRSLGLVRIVTERDEDIVRNSPHLKELKCVCGRDREFPVLCSLAELESLKVDFNYVPERTILSENNFPAAIRKLHISRSVFPWEKISVIGRLPNLHVLKLGPYAFWGKVWETRDGEFQKLRFLKIEVSAPVEWNVSSSDHFPSLECLIFQKCFDLKEIPGELGELPTMQRLEVRECSNDMNLSALQIEEQQREYDNEELQIIITNSRRTRESLVEEYELKKQNESETE